MGTSTGERAAGWHPLDLCMVAWLLVEIASTWASVSPTISLLGDADQHEGLLTSLGLAGLYGGARVATVDAASARRTLWVTLAAIAAACVVAFWQLASFDPSQWQNAPAYRGWYRPFGSLGHANLLGALAAGAFAAVFGLAVSRALGKAWRVAGLLLFGATAVVTFSRAAWLAAGLGSLAALALDARWRGRAMAREKVGGPRIGAATVVTTLGTAVFLLALFTWIEPMRARALELLSLDSGSGRARLEIWKTALAMWNAHPWLGSGPDTFQLLFARYQTHAYWLFEWGTDAFHAHSIYLHVLATRGIAGVLVAAAVSGAAVFSLRAGWRGDAVARELVPGLAGLLAALGLAGISGALGIAGAAVVACTLGTLPAITSSRPSAPKRAASRRPRSWVPLAAGALAGLLILLPTAAQMRASGAAFLADQETEGWRAIALARRAEQLAPWSDRMASDAADLLRRYASRTSDPRGTLSLAEGSARRAIQLAPERLGSQSELALILLARAGAGAVGADREAAAAVARCSDLGPYNVLPLIHYCEAALQIGRGDLALPIARRATALYPGEALPQAMLGEAYLALGDPAAARTAMERSIGLEWRDDRGRRDRIWRKLMALRAGHPRGIVLGHP